MGGWGGGVGERSKHDLHSNPFFLGGGGGNKHDFSLSLSLSLSYKGGRVSLMSSSCLEFQGCHLIPFFYLLSCFSD